MMNAAEISEKKSTTTHRKIRKAAILGSGVMGSRIAMHFANIGVQAVLLDIVPFNLDDKDKNNPKMRNKIVNDAFAAALKSSPSPVYHAKVAEKVTLGNFDDNLNLIADCDFIIEAVVERLDIKQSLYEKVEKFRKPGTIIASNTSGIPMSMLIEGRSEDFQKNFCGVHFFNPPRYLRLLEIIPGPKTDASVVDFLMKYGDLYLGKETVLCKDTPAFIANRVGIYGIMSALHTVEKLGLSVSEVDKLTGPVIGRPKSATFRTLDVVGLDTAIKVAKGLYDNCPKDESKAKFALPKIVSELEKNGWFGDKTKQGYYKMTKDGGKKQLFELNLKTFEYEPEKKAKFDVLEKTKEIENLKNRFAVLLADEGKAGEFYRATFYDMFRYVSFRIPEISDELYRIDKAICAGFGWELGPFVTWDALGVRETTAKMEAAGEKPAQWVYDMLASGNESFYKVENGITKYYDIPSKSYRSIPGSEGFIILDNLRSTKKVWGNAGASIFDLGDGVLGLEYHTKMNAIGQEIIEGIHHAVNLAEKNYRGLVIGNDSPQFSAGANLGMVYMFAAEQEFDELDMMVRQFQQTMMRLRYSAIPVVGAPSGLALGGGCETLLHCDKVVAHAESYVGLVEVGVGLIPAGGGTKEMILRASDTYRKDDTEVNRLGESFMNIATAKVATSAHEAVNLGYFRDSDRIVINRARLLSEAKTAVLEIDEKGYTQPMKRKDIKVLGKTALANFTAGATGMLFGHYISEHDLKIAKKLAYVMAGGDLDAPAMVSEDYLLDLEREAFLSLCGEKKTLERIHSILFSGKPLRN
jgi:3-hydroxyacyl-CoA dehydrogenase